jgi:type I restriction enzyme R subunit
MSARLVNILTQLVRKRHASNISRWETRNKPPSSGSDVTLVQKPLRLSPTTRPTESLVTLRQSFEQTIDAMIRITFAAGFQPMRRSAQKRLRMPSRHTSTRKDEITALQVLYSQPYAKRLTFKDIKELAERFTPPRSWTPDMLWRVYEPPTAIKSMVPVASGS